MATVTVTRASEGHSREEARQKDRAAKESPHSRKDRLTRVALFVVAIGVVWRLTRYLLAFPIWGDEAMLLVNYADKGYLDVAGPLENCQVAPLCFHWAELSAIRLFGTSELAVRLPPLLACLGSLPLFWRLACVTLPPRARLFAVAILAVSIWPATMGSLVKPYTFDLFFSLLLLLCAAEWRRSPQRLRWLIALTLAVPVALLSSYPAVFIAGAVSVALLPVVWKHSRAAWLCYAAFNVLLVATFAGHYLIVARAQMASASKQSTTADEMRTYWSHGFPPADASLPLWLLAAHAGQMAAYPVGAAGGGSVVTVALCAAGAWRLRRRRWLLGLLAAAFALGLAAAVARAYPYGASCRLAQHLAPAYCLLAGLGLSSLLLRRPRTSLVVLVALASLGVGGIVRDLAKPHRDAESVWAARLMTDVDARAAGETVIVRTQGDESPVLRWHLLRRKARQNETAWTLGDEPSAGWRCVERRDETLTPARQCDPARHVTLERWARVE